MIHPIELKIVKMSVINENVEEKRTRGDYIHYLRLFLYELTAYCGKNPDNIIDPIIIS